MVFAQVPMILELAKTALQVVYMAKPKMTVVSEPKKLSISKLNFST